MTLATGKSGQYRYYKRSRKSSMGAKACDSASIPLDELDSKILQVFADRHFTPERVHVFLRALREELKQQVSSEQCTLLKLNTD